MNMGQGHESESALEIKTMSKVKKPSNSKIYIIILKSGDNYQNKQL